MTFELTEAEKAQIEAIAKNQLNLDTLETRKSDRLDFSDQAVWNIRLALITAFNVGKCAADAEARREARRKA
jgi:hypothetical protein